MEEEKQKWTMDYINSQLREQNDRWVEIETHLETAKAQVKSLEVQKCHYETIICMLKTIKNGLTVEAKPTGESA